MKLLKVLFSILLLSLFTENANAQFGLGKIKEIEAVQQRKLIVMLEVPDADFIKKLTKKGETVQLNSYKELITKYNNSIKEVVEQYWPYIKNGVEYKTFNEIEELRKSKNEDYAVLFSVTQVPFRYNAGNSSSHGLAFVWDEKSGSYERYLDNSLQFTSLDVNLIEDFKKSTPVYSAQLPDIYPTKASLIFGVSSMTTYFDFRIRKKKNGENINLLSMYDDLSEANASKLKEMNLLIREDLISKNLPQSSIKDFYPFKYTLATKNDIDNAIINKDDAAYLVILPNVVSGSKSNQIFYLHFIYSAKNNELLAFLRPTTLGLLAFGVGGANAGKRTIEKNNLVRFTNLIRGTE
jgi:hypothetical protein